MSGLDAPTEQVQNAKKIQATGVALKIPPRGQVVALATALQESGLRNLNNGDRDSLGLFQQRPSQGWGTAAQVRDPVHASTSFYTHLKKIAGWQSMTVAQAAQAVQASGFPDAYAKWEPLATALQKALAKAIKDGGGSGKDTDKGDGDQVDARAGVSAATRTARRSVRSRRGPSRRATRSRRRRPSQFVRRSGGVWGSSGRRTSGAAPARTRTARTRWTGATAPV